MGTVKGSRVILNPKPADLEQWESWARTFRKPLVPFVVFVMNAAVRYFREMERGRKTALDPIGLRLDQKDKLRARVEAARDALDKLAQSLR